MSQRKALKRVATRPASLKIKRAATPEETVHAPAEFKLMFAPGRYLVYSQYRGQFQVHVLEYAYKSMSNGMGECEYPTKKGVCFTPARLKVLCNKIEEIDEHLKNQNTPYVSSRSRDLCLERQVQWSRSQTLLDPRGSTRNGSYETGNLSTRDTVDLVERKVNRATVYLSRTFLSARMFLR